MKKMLWKAISPVIIISLLLVACSSSNQQVTNSPGVTSATNTPVPSSALTDMGGRDLIVAEGNDTPPFAYLDATTKKPVGFDYDFFPEICKRANCKVVFKEFSWDGVFEAGAAGEWDITLWGIALTIDRTKKVDFASPVVQYYHELVVRADSPYKDVKSFVDSKAIIGAVPGSAEEIDAKNLVGDSRIHSYETFDLPPLATKSGDIDGFVSVNFVTNTIMKDNPGVYKILGTTNSPSFIAPPMRPGFPYETAINVAIRKMWEDGTMDTLQKKWGLEAQ